MTDDSLTNSDISFRQSGQLGASRQLLTALGVWLTIGVFALHDYIVGRAGSAALWAFLLTTVLLLPTLISHIELRSWIKPGGGSFRLIKALERNPFTFVTGWLYLLGWATVSGIVAMAFGQFGSDFLLNAMEVRVDGMLLALGLVIVTILLLLLHGKPLSNIAQLAVIVGFVGILGYVGILAVRFIGTNSVIGSFSVGTNRFIEAVALVISSYWSIETASALQGGRRKPPLQRLLYLAVGPLTAAVFVGLVNTTISPSRTLSAISTTLLGSEGPLILSLVGLLITAFMLQVIAFVFLRLFQSIGNDGCYAPWLIRRNKFAQTPTGIIVLMGLLSVGALAIQSIVMLAQIAAFTLLLLQIGVNIAAIDLARQKRAQSRSITLPLWPIIQASGAAICFLLLITLPPIVALIGVGWIVMSILFYFQFGRTAMRDRQMGLTVFQNSTIDLRSKYPVIVPVSNPNTVRDLVVFGAEAAKNHDGHLLLVQIVVVPDDKELDEARAEAEDRLEALHLSLEEAKQFDVPVEGVTRLARSVQQGVLDTIVEENASLVVVGWPGNPEEEVAGALGPILEDIVTLSPCDVAVVRGAWDPDTKSILIPAGGGPHAIAATDLGLSLTFDADGAVTLLNVARNDADREAYQQGLKTLKSIHERFSKSDRIKTKIKRSDSPLDGILSVLDDYDAIMFGASGSSFFIEQNVIGRLQLEVIKNTNKPVALVRGYTGVTNLVVRRTWQSLYDLLPTLSIDEQVDLLERMRSSAVPSVNYFVLIILSAMIATFGLLQNSAAVIIGAMLVAPLMSPIVASGMGIVRGDLKTFRNGLVSTLQGLLASVFLAVLLTLFTPIAAATPEVIARTQPTLLDMMVALVSGAAGAYAIARTEVGAALPGVAIAAALMPPICTIGIGIALGQVAYASGATLLFFTNLFSIIVAAALTFLLLGVRPPEREDRQRQLQQGLRLSIFTLAAISIPLAFLLFSQVRQESIRTDALTLIEETTSGWGETEVIELQFQFSLRAVTINGTVYANGEVNPTDIGTLEDEIETRTNRDVTLVLDVVPVTRLDSSDQ